MIAEGKEHKDFDGETYILERGIVADLAIVKAWKGDEQGNLVYRKTARNFNPNAATCGKVCVAEVEEIVPLGSLDPDGIHTPGIFVHRIIRASTRSASSSAPSAPPEEDSHDSRGTTEPPRPPSAITDQFVDAGVAKLDALFGAGYAKANPPALAAYVAACASNLNAFMRPRPRR